MRIRFVSLIMTVVLGLAACQPAPSPAPPASPTFVPPTASSPLTPTVTVAPTFTRVPTAAPTGTNAPTVAPSATATVRLTLAPTAVPFQVQVDSPEVGYVNVRNAPSTGGSLVTQVDDGAVLDVLDPVDAARGRIGQQGQWLKIRTTDGKEGFVAAWYLRLPGLRPAPPTAVPAPLDLAGAALELYNRANAFRAQNGLASYQYVERLAAAAERHSQDMANTGKVDHAGSDGSTARQRILDTGYGDWITDEVIYGGAASTEAAWNDWVNDPNRRPVLLNPKLLDVGIAVVKGQGGMFFYTMDFGGRPAQAPDPTPRPAPTLIAVLPSSPTPTPNPALDVAVDLLNRTNALRAQNRLPLLRLSAKLTAAAERHSQDMSNTGNIDHSGSDGSRTSRRIADTGYEARYTGENVYAGQITVDAAWAYWRDDPPHRANLLNAQFTEMGVSVVRGARGWYYFTMDLARPAR